MKRLARMLLIVVPALVAIGCTTVPVQNITDQTFTTNRPASLEEIGNTIVRAGASLNMQMRKVRPGLINATYAVRGVSAVMEIKYSTKSYSIEYKDSQGLKYDGTNIHKNYNSWVQNLNNRIQAQMSAL